MDFRSYLSNVTLIAFAPCALHAPCVVFPFFPFLFFLLFMDCMVRMAGWLAGWPAWPGWGRTVG